jgi:3-isopropylmalate dehydrogenase
MRTVRACQAHCLNGDDIGHEIVPASVAIARAAAELHGVASTGARSRSARRALETHGHTLPPETLDTLKTLDGWILGPIGHRAYPKGPTRSTRTRSCASSSTCSPTCGPRGPTPTSAACTTASTW